MYAKWKILDQNFALLTENFLDKKWPNRIRTMGVETGGAEGAAAPQTFGTGEQAIALAPPKVWAFWTGTVPIIEELELPK